MIDGDLKHKVTLFLIYYTGDRIVVLSRESPIVCNVLMNKNDYGVEVNHRPNLCTKTSNYLNTWTRTRSKHSLSRSIFFSFLPNHTEILTDSVSWLVYGLVLYWLLFGNYIHRNFNIIDQRCIKRTDWPSVGQHRPSIL